MSSGVSAVGPIHKAASVRENCSDCTTWLTARREGQREVLDGQRILDDINDEVDCCFLKVNLWLNLNVASYRFDSTMSHRMNVETCLVSVSLAPFYAVGSYEVKFKVNMLQLENRIESPDLYIGVTKRRKCCVGSEKPGSITSLAFHGVKG